VSDDADDGEWDFGRPRNHDLAPDCDVGVSSGLQVYGVDFGGHKVCGLVV
jgi:hypothetical protein